MEPCDQSLSEAAIRDDDIALFREAMQGVKPLAGSGRVIHSQSVQQLQTRFSALVSTDNEEVSPDDWLPDTAESEEWSFTRPGLQRSILRKLRRGNWLVQDELDLHGLNRDEARRALGIFLDSCIAQAYRCVRVIHGRGLSSRNRRPVLKMLVGNWLMQHNGVLAFCQALPEQGGSGAVLILLKNADK